MEELHVLTEVNYFSILRNEVNKRASQQVAAKWSHEGGGYSATDDRSQRHTLGLREVAYVIVARQVLRGDVTDDPAKYRDQFRRRVRDGRCFATPYLGCREFSASFGELDGSEVALSITEDLGPMLLDVAYRSDTSGRELPQFWNARLERGVLHVPRGKEEA